MFLYILESLVDGTLYKGVSDNPEKRLKTHNAGGSKSTRPKRPWKSIYTEFFEDKREAYRMERKLKSLHSRIAVLKWIESRKVPTAPSAF